MKTSAIGGRGGNHTYLGVPHTRRVAQMDTGGTPEVTTAKSSYAAAYVERLSTMHLPDGANRIQAYEWALIRGPELQAEAVAAATTTHGPRDRRTADDFLRAAYLEAIGDPQPDAETLAADLAELGTFFGILAAAPTVKDPKAARRLTETVLLRFMKESKTVGVDWPRINGVHFRSFMEAVVTPLIGRASIGSVEDQTTGLPEAGDEIGEAVVVVQAGDEIGEAVVVVQAGDAPGVVLAVDETVELVIVHTTAEPQGGVADGEQVDPATVEAVFGQTGDEPQPVQADGGTVDPVVAGSGQQPGDHEAEPVENAA